MNIENNIKKSYIKKIINLALSEDVKTGDATTIALVPEKSKVTAEIISRGNYVLSGLDIAINVFKMVDPTLQFEKSLEDSDPIKPDEVILKIFGSARSILTAERTALNFMQRMTGIATQTARFVKKVKKYGTMILDTRKTTPALRSFEKYAVLCGGGYNHRYGLFDKILIKDNHRKLWKKGKLHQAIDFARKKFPSLEIEIEVESIAELKDALKGNPDWILLDNMSNEIIAECVDIANGKALLEASGGINLKSVISVAKTGVDAISLGCLTHTIESADLSLELDI